MGPGLPADDYRRGSPSSTETAEITAASARRVVPFPASPDAHRPPANLPATLPGSDRWRPSTTMG